MKLLILGAGNLQLNAIRRAKAMGHTVIVSDYHADPPGKMLADVHEQVSTFDVEGNLRVAARYQVDGIMTVGTDQPVYTVAQVAQTLNLPALIDVPTALAVTNKKVMKQRFLESAIPTARYVLLREDFQESELAAMGFPVVVKPLDSQGQRGVYKLSSIREIREVFRDVLSYSRQLELMVEEYYPSREITVSGWVSAGETFVVGVVDRITFEVARHIGICTAHHLPSQFLATRHREIADLTERLVACFGIRNGPIYFQFLVGAEGIKVNEIACRIGGAYEDIYLPRATGIDMLDMVIQASLGKKVDCSPLEHHDWLANQKHLAVELFFATPCTIASLSSIQRLLELPGVIHAQYNFGIGDRIGEITDATQRAGVLMVEGKNETELAANRERARAALGIFDECGNNHILG
ncbi:phosphoribosylaminoimidazole carboxylase (NCAIR synthetase) [Hydrogenispora ethanolica]|uniref:Phosphoribosylaminoimidazole carboxylase (NCAIR synthetase) n=1 Tax=Hydrogenispora ethanolica TaxID=1082276 RepID=A0A4R1RSU0_HYDET|nr:ATP-grasp domain-containing protein [Hydrogenispora ethanolica]TCL69399.1 phosphoribosylaminoimidazole carboxylase (NCAIR synthetase) [Hydrogenispora ethanolica]